MNENETRTPAAKIAEVANKNEWFASVAKFNVSQTSTTFSRGLQTAKLVADKHGKVVIVVVDGKRVNGRGRIAELVNFLSGPRRDAEPREYPASMIENDDWAAIG